MAYSAAKTALGVIAKSVAKTAGALGITCKKVRDKGPWILSKSPIPLLQFWKITSLTGL
jgi:hypothetical protein